MNLDREDAEYLLNRPEFLRFMCAAIQSAGVVTHTGPANGRSAVDLAAFEARRCLGLEMIAALDAGQPEPLRSPLAFATLDQIIRSEMNATPKEKPRGRRNDRYDDDSDGTE